MQLNSARKKRQKTNWPFKSIKTPGSHAISQAQRISTKSYKPFYRFSNVNLLVFRNWKWPSICFLFATTNYLHAFVAFLYFSHQKKKNLEKLPKRAIELRCEVHSEKHLHLNNNPRINGHIKFNALASNVVCLRCTMLQSSICKQKKKLFSSKITETCDWIKIEFTRAKTLAFKVIPQNKYF